MATENDEKRIFELLDTMRDQISQVREDLARLEGKVDRPMPCAVNGDRIASLEKQVVWLKGMSAGVATVCALVVSAIAWIATRLWK